MAQSIGEVKRMEPPHSEMMSELRIRIVGSQAEIGRQRHQVVPFARNVFLLEQYPIIRTENSSSERGGGRLAFQVGS